MKKLLIISFVVLTLVVSALLVGPSFVDWNKYKPQILAQMTKMTGHSYEINGQLDFAILPSPRLIIEDFVMANPETNENLITLQSASVHVSLMPLLSGNIEVSKVSLVQPVIEIEVASDGTQSWMTGQLQDRMSSQDDTTEDSSNKQTRSIVLDQIIIQDASFSYQNNQTGQSINIQDVDFGLKAQSIYGPYSADGSISYQSNVFDFQAKVGRIDQLAESIPLDIKVFVPNAGTELEYKGIVQKTEGQGEVALQGETSFKSDNLSRSLQVLTGQENASVSFPVSTTGILTFEDQALSFGNASLILDRSRADFSVNVKNIGTSKPLNVTLGLNSTDSFDLEGFMPSKGKGANQNKNSRDSFLPKSVVLPMDLILNADVKMAELVLAGTSYQNLSLILGFQDKTLTSDLKASLGNTEAIDVSARLSFASRSQNTGDNTFILADPKLTLSGDIDLQDPQEFVQNLGVSVPDGASPLLSSPVSLDIEKLDISSRSVKLQPSNIKLLDDTYSIGASYSLASAPNKNKLSLSLSANDIDLDKWQRTFAKPKPKGQEDKPLDIKKIAQSFTVPVNLDLHINLKNPTLKTESYDLFSMKLDYTGNAVSIESVQLLDQEGNNIVLSGAVNNIKDLAGLDLTVTASTPNIKRALSDFGISVDGIPAGIESVTSNSTVKGSIDNISFVTNINASDAKIEAKGRVENALAKPVFDDLELRLRHPDYSRFIKLFAPEFRGGKTQAKSFDLYSKVVGENKSYNFENLKVQIGPSVIEGSLQADLSGSKPSIVSDLKIDSLPLGDLMGVSSRSSARATAQRNTAPANTQGNVRWSRNAIPTAALHKIDLKLSAQVNTLTYGEWLVENTKAGLSLKNGVLQINRFKSNAYGGAIDLTAELSAANDERQPLNVKTKGSLQNVNLEKLVQALSGKRLVQAGGNISLDYDVKTSGLSPAALIVDLSGNVNTSGQNIVIQGFDLAKLSRALSQPSSSFTQNFGALTGATLEQGQTRFDTLEGVFPIQEGVVKIQTLILDGPDAVLRGQGNINLPLWFIDMKSIINLKEPENAPELAIDFKGPLDDPKQTFAKRALEQYFQSQIQGLLLNPLLEKLAPRTQSPAPQTSDQTGDGTQSQQPADQQRPRDVDPEDVLKGVLGDFLRSQ